MLDQVPGHDGRFRIRLVRPLAAGDDHGPVRMLLHEGERLVEPLFERQRRLVALYLRAEYDDKLRRLVLRHNAVLSLHGNIPHCAEDHRHTCGGQAGQKTAPMLRRVLFLQEPQCQQHRRKQQQTDARHADMQRQRQTHRAEHCKQRDHPNRNHVEPSKSDESRSHSSIRPVSASSQDCFSAISRASS